MRYLKFLGLLIVSVVLLGGCASVAHVEKDDSVNFNKYSAFTWVQPREDRDDTVVRRVSDLTETRIRQAVNAELAKAGWRESNTRPDVLISYDVMVEGAMRQETNPVYSQPFTRYVYNPYSRRWFSIYYPSEFLGYDRNQRSVREGTVTISVIDAKTEKTVWQGWTTGEVNSRNLTSKEVQNAVKSIFRKFAIAKN